MIAVEFNGDGDECHEASTTVKGLYHLEGLGADYTLCGETLDGDIATAGTFNMVKVNAINCPECVKVISQCAGVKTINTQRQGSA